MPHPALKWRSETCLVLLPMVSQQFMSWAACYQVTWHVGLQSNLWPPLCCAHIGVGPYMHRGCRNTSQAF